MKRVRNVFTTFDQLTQAALDRASKEHRAAVGSLESALSKVLGKRGSQLTDSIDLAKAVAASKRALGGVARSVADSLLESAKDAAKAAGKVLQQYGRDVPLASKLLHRPSPEVTAAHKAALEILLQNQARSLSKDAAADIRRAMQNSVASNRTVNDTIRAALEAADGQGYRVARTARTAVSYAFNEAQDAAISALAEVEPGIYRRWTELISDETWQPLDNRVALDSMVLHGQVSRPGGVFTMPPDVRAPAAMVGRSWSQPPNRCNDRGVLLPWHRSWRIPAWEYRAGRKLWLVPR